MTEREFDLRAPRLVSVSAASLGALSPRVVWAIADRDPRRPGHPFLVVDGYPGDVLFVSGVVLTLGALLLGVRGACWWTTVLLAAIVSPVARRRRPQAERTGVVLPLTTSRLSCALGPPSAVCGTRTEATRQLACAVARMGLLGWIAWRATPARAPGSTGLRRLWPCNADGGSAR